ncbi:MAG: hypothetical protein J0647_07545 [Campylobacteraceae bacterium]|nr:hypothetical protein [Campylobacteraceae bacterium]
MYFITASIDLQFLDIIKENDSLIIDEDMPVLDGDLVLLQSGGKKGVAMFSDLMTINEGVSCHVIHSVNKPCKDSDRALRLQKCGL